MNRKTYIDYMRAFAILLVIAGHANAFNDPVKNWIYSFHMPLFFIISGLTLSEKKLSLKIVEKKVRVLLVPYIVWGLLYSSLTPGNVVKICYGSYRSIASAGSLTSLWFLPTMFIAYFISQILIKIRKSVLRLLFVMGVFLVGCYLPKIKEGYPWCLNIGFIAAAFIFAGYLIKELTDKRWSLGIMIAGTMIGAAGTWMYHLNSVNVKSYILMASGRIGNPAWFVISSLCGFIFIYFFSKIVEYYLPGNEIISYLGQNTMTVFLINKPILQILEDVLNRVAVKNEIRLILAVCITAIVACLISKVINVFLPAAVGKKV